MANYCEIKESQKCQTLSKMSGISPDSVAEMCTEYQDLYGIFPELDNIPDANSEPYLRESLELKTTKSGTTYQSTQNILDKTSSSSIEEANATINDTHRDLDVRITDINGVSIFEIKPRPSEYRIGSTPYSITATNDSQVQCGIIDSLDKMRKYYGINIIPITSDDDFPGLNVSGAKAFINNGNIYVNIDNAGIDSPIHEMLHLFLGTLSRQNSNMFYELVNSVEQLSDYDYRSQFYPNRTRSDVNEEIFVEELSKYLTGQKSLLSELNDNVLNKMLYCIQRDLDTFLDGNYSVKSLDNLYDCSLKELAEMTESNIFNIETGGHLNKSTIHRMLANLKEKYLKSNELTENCE